jgi:plasmid replication initiation protein
MAKHKNLIVKSNYIVEASYKLSVGEQRVIYVLTAMINKDDEDFKLYKFTAKEFANIIGTKSKNIYSQVSQYVEALRDRDLTIIKEKSVLKTKWLSSAEYFVDEGYVELEFSPKLKPYLLLLKERFTKLSLEQMVNFNSQYAGRIYEFLKQYQNIGFRTFKIEGLKALLGIENGEYKLYGDFKRKILLKAQQEINHESELLIDFEEIKTGRKVTSIKFYITSNKAKNEIAATVEEDDTEDIKQVQAIVHEGITDINARAILKAANGDIEKIKEKYNIISQLSKVNNLVGAMVKALKENWTTTSIQKVSTFNNYEQRTYDFDELEKKLLGWDNK